MARIDIKSTGVNLDAGLLQLANGVAMSATLTAVTDQNNTASPLLLSTTGVQSTSKIQITTSDTNYIDAEDNAGNNRFTVGRGVGSQLVTVDFASVPTDLTTAVGAIRTATNGSSLANVQTFLENGNIGFGTDTPGSKLDVHSAANTIAQFNRTGTGNSQIQHLMTGTARWTTGFVSATGNYSIYDNVNSLFRTNLSNTGKLTIGNGDTALTGQLNVKGSGSTSATTSLLVQNSSNTTILSLNDAGTLSVGAGSQGIIVAGTLSLQYPNTITYNSSYNMIIGGTTAGSGNISIDGSSIRFLAANNGITYTQGIPKSFLIKKEQGGSDTTSFLNISGADQTLSSYAGAGGVVRIYGGLNNGIAAQGLLILAHNGTTTQGAVVVGGTSANAAALLDIQSTTQGFLPPRMTTAQKNAIATPAAGLMVYDTDLNKLCVRTAAAWETITSI